MNFWLFQAVEKRYDLRDKKQIKVGQKDTWHATRYRGRMKAGDEVFFWQGGLGDQCGIYIVGELVSEPYKKKGWEAYGVDVKYKKRLVKPLLVKQIKNNANLSDMLILRAPHATNFTLSSKEGSTLQKLISPGGK